MSVLDCILLGICTIIIPGMIYSWAIFKIMGVFDKKNKEVSENESKEKKKTANWKFDPTTLKASDLAFLLTVDPYIYHCASDEAKKKMDEILKGRQPKEKENKEQS